MLNPEERNRARKKAMRLLEHMDRTDQGCQFAKERTADGKHCRTADNLYAVNLCHSHNTDVLTVSGGRHRTKASGNCGGEENKE